jgi:hypothetical protein
MALPNNTHRIRGEQPLTPTLSPLKRGEGEGRRTAFLRSHSSLLHAPALEFVGDVGVDLGGGLQVGGGERGLAGLLTGEAAAVER